MSYSESLTNEKISKAKKNQFELVLYAIGLTKNIIRTGRASRVLVHTENPALIALAEIEAGKDVYEAEEISARYRTV